MLDVLVAESAGLLPQSMKSDSLRKAVFRPPPAPGSKEGMTLAAVSTVAATPAVGASGSGQQVVSQHSRTYLAVGAAAIAVGGIVAGIWYANAATKPGADGGQRQLIVVQSPTPSPSAATAESAAPAASAPPAPSLELAAPVSAPAASSPSAAPTVSARSLVKRRSEPQPAKVTPTVAPDSQPKQGVGADLKIKPQ